MSNQVNSNASENPDLVPVSGLQREWIDGYLQSAAPRDSWKEDTAPPGEDIPSCAVHYPQEAPEQFRFVFSGLQQERVEQFMAELKIDAKITSHSDEDQTPLPDQPFQDDQVDEGEVEADVKGGSGGPPPSVDGLALPDIEVPLDATDDNFEDTYYANLLRKYPERVLVTLEYLEPDQKSEDDAAISYTIDPSIDEDIVHHYRTKSQTGASSSVSATSGSVTLEMWRWFRDFDNARTKQALGSQLSVAGVDEEQLSLRHSDFPNKSDYDVSVTGNQDGSKYTISGSWDLES